ncbi:MAG: hypothetical protein AVDCRST_MAG67-180, partial [uncultured Solirubrobacteraceae bacterium]
MPAEGAMLTRIRVPETAPTEMQ